MSTTLPLEQALQARNAPLVRLAITLGEVPHSAHLQAVLEGFQDQERTALARLLVMRGADPTQGTPSAIARARALGAYEAAWAMQAAWTDRDQAL